MGIIRLRCSRKTVVLSTVTTHHRGIAGCRPLCPAAYMRFRQHFSACRWENQVACGMNYGDYPAAPRLPASPPHLRGRSLRLFQPGRARSPTGKNTEGKGRGLVRGLPGIGASRPPARKWGGRMPLELSREKSAARLCRRRKGRGAQASRPLRRRWRAPVGQAAAPSGAR